MDLKPENIVIDNRFNVKFIDFSQTVHPSIPLSKNFFYIEESKPGVSTPYSPN
jgi:serine/threonine protein kinase